MFEFVVHVEASFGDVKIIDLDAPLLSSIHPVSQNLLVIVMQGGHGILTDVPRHVLVVIVAEHDSRGERWGWG